MLKGEKAIIRNIRSSDLEVLIQKWGDLSTRGEYFPLNILNEATIKQRFQENGFWSEGSGHMAVTDTENHIVGVIFFFTPNPFLSYIEVGYILFDTAERGKGYMSEALSLFSTFLLSSKQISKILLNIHPDNIGSRKVAEKNGFVSEGIDRKGVFMGGQYQDIERFTLCRDDL